MRIAIVNTMTPFVKGGAEILVDDLYEQLRLRGYDTELFRIPFPNDFGAPFMNTIAASKMLNFDEFDRVITFKFPAYCIRHHAMVIWLFHQFRQVYDLKDTEYGFEPGGYIERIARVVRNADDVGIPKARHIFTIANEVAGRLKQYSGIDSAVMRTPLKDPGVHYNGGTGDYIFCPSRVNNLKRQFLAVQAMKYAKSGVRLVIAGQCNEPGYFEKMTAFVKENNLEKKVVFKNEWITDEQKVEYMAKCLACIYIPYKEDSSGLVTLEAQYSGKPMITCSDSGGTVELVENGVNGYVADSTPQELAKVMDKLYEDKIMAEKMGQLAYASVVAQDITWDNTIRRLLK